MKNSDVRAECPGETRIDFCKAETTVTYCYPERIVKRWTVNFCLAACSTSHWPPRSPILKIARSAPLDRS